jgi:hypothetical protein
MEWTVTSRKFPMGLQAAARPAGRGFGSVGRKARHHASRAREAWQNYYRYKRLEAHGNPGPWHGRKRIRRMAITAMIWGAIIAYGLYHTL